MEKNVKQEMFKEMLEPIIPIENQRQKLKLILGRMKGINNILSDECLKDIVKEYKNNPKLIYEENLIYLGKKLIENCEDIIQISNYLYKEKSKNKILKNDINFYKKYSPIITRKLKINKYNEKHLERE